MTTRPLALFFLFVSPAISSLAETISVPGDHPTIQNAIDAANAYDVILVDPGTYHERIRLKPDVHLRSAGKDDKGTLGLERTENTIIDGGGEVGDAPGVAMAEGATLDGFTVMNTGTYDDTLWKKHHATRGEGQKHEHIGGFGAPGIGIDAVTCTVRNNIVHHNGHTGIAVRGADNQTVTPRISNNLCYRNMGGGIGLLGGAGGIVENNTCFENYYAGIGHSSGAIPLVQNNTCYQNIRAGIGISEGACPVVRSNRCYQNRRAGIGTRTGIDTAPIIDDNDCYENGMAGIGTDEGASPLIRGNRCRENEMAGIGARHASHPIIIGNECTGNKAAALGLENSEGGTALIHGNTINATTVVAIGIQSGWEVTLTKNKIHGGDGMPPAIMVFEGASATFSKNTITGGGVAGIRVAGTARVFENHFEGTALRKVGPPNFAVWALGGSTAHLADNSMKNWRHALFASGASIAAINNRVENFHGAAFVVESPSSFATITENIVTTDDPDAGVFSLKNDLFDSATKGNRKVEPATP